jgi:alkanesulfonate monooxygenase SsuD/methylene tetrahydromethanopterin reductase-like flavin-dependent oxidoreductase (luciferase family)
MTGTVMTDARPVTFGLKTSPVHMTYEAIQRAWLQADEVTEIEHAWLWDHLLPLTGPRDGYIFEGWTLLAALAAQTRRLRLGLMVSSNRIRPPAVLGKMATTVDVISGGRLVLGLGVGGTRQPADSHGIPGDNPGIAEFAAYGLSLVPPGEGIGRLAESLTILRRMFTEDVFDFDGTYYTLTGTRNQPAPVQQPGPPILVGGSGTRLLRVAAEHADIWNVPGPPHGSLEFVTERSRVLDQHCAAIGRDPASLTRSVQLLFPVTDAATVRPMIGALVAAGFGHIVLAVRPPWPDNVARWLADEIISPVRQELLAAAG